MLCDRIMYKEKFVIFNIKIILNNPNTITTRISDSLPEIFDFNTYLNNDHLKTSILSLQPILISNCNFSISLPEAFVITSHKIIFGAFWRKAKAEIILVSTVIFSQDFIAQTSKFAGKTKNIKSSALWTPHYFYLEHFHFSEYETFHSYYRDLMIRVLLQTTFWVFSKLE